MSYAEDKLHVRERTGKHVKACFAAGVCPYCWEKRPLDTGKKACRICLDKLSARRRQLLKTTDYGNKQRAVCKRNQLFGNRTIAGTPMYFYLKKHNFPDKDRYQVLCQSCQARKRVLGDEFKITFPWKEVKVSSLSVYANTCK